MVVQITQLNFFRVFLFVNKGLLDVKHKDFLGGQGNTLFSVCLQ